MMLAVIANVIVVAKTVFTIVLCFRLSCYS
jgi:hypothetical protein